MVAGVKADPNWSAMQNKTTMEVSKIMRQTSNEIADIINKTYQNRSRSQDRINERWDRTIRGEVLIEDPTTGERFEVPSGSSYYWRVGSGQEFIGTETADSPNLPNHWVQEMRISD